MQTTYVYNVDSIIGIIDKTKTNAINRLNQVTILGLFNIDCIPSPTLNQKNEQGNPKIKNAAAIENTSELALLDTEEKAITALTAITQAFGLNH